jgi:hypothetical protein
MLKQDEVGREEEETEMELNMEMDVTKLPAMLDQQFSALDSDHAVRACILHVGPSWTKRAQAALLGNERTEQLQIEQQGREKQAAFDLLDALTRSGALELEHASLHVLVAAAHGFDQSLLESVVCKNMNPIERVERSALIMASALHGAVAVRELVHASQHVRLAAGPCGALVQLD